jgi:3-isopropylmalate dehydrogenase
VIREAAVSAGADLPSPRLTDCLPGWAAARAARRPACIVGVFPGEGIGPEVVGAALVVLEAVAEDAGVRLEVRRGGSVSPPSRCDRELGEEAVAFCESAFASGGAILCGPASGRAVYDLRGRFDLYCKLVPLRPSPALADAAIVHPARVDGADVLIVRENVGGLYFGEFGRRDGGRTAYQALTYRADQVSRILAVGAAAARARRGRLAVIVKRGGVPEVSTLWIEQAEAVAAGPDVAVEVLDVDNATYQVIAAPRRFDVVVTPNLFGDILADAATVLLGSRGMSYSANLGPDGRAVYQTGHGAAHDLAGSDTANPVAQILSLAMLLRESFGLDLAARRIEAAVERVLAAGFRTPDIAGPASQVVGTRALAERIAREAAALREAAGC